MSATPAFIRAMIESHPEPDPPKEQWQADVAKVCGGWSRREMEDWIVWFSDTALALAMRGPRLGAPEDNPARTLLGIENNEELAHQITKLASLIEDLAIARRPIYQRLW